MTKNYMKEVANLLGLELEEEFKIKELSDKTYKFTPKGLVGDCGINFTATITMTNLLNGMLEIEKPILNQKEKEYLSAVVRPFRDKCVCIAKEPTSAKDEYISIYLENVTLSFPYFKPGEMYKGMELNKDYTLEELGL